MNDEDLLILIAKYEAEFDLERCKVRGLCALVGLLLVCLFALGLWK